MAHAGSDVSSPTKLAPFALTAVGIGAAAALALGGALPPALVGTLPDLVADAYQLVHDGAGRTTIMIGGASDPDATQMITRTGVRGTDSDRLLYVIQPASVGIGGVNGLPVISGNGIGKGPNYVGTVETGSANTVSAINAGTDQVVIYTLSQGSDVADVGLLKYDAAPTPGRTVHLVQYGNPSFPGTGWWSIIPAGIPGLPGYGPLDMTGLQNSTVTDLCVRGDTVCGAGNPLATPLATVLYAYPGFYMHGRYYTYDNLSPYSTPDVPGTVTGATTGPDGAVDAGVLVPGAANQQHYTERVVTRADGTAVTERTYDDGTITRTWQQGSATYVVVDNGENPWGWMLRDMHIPVPKQADQVLNLIVPVPNPGEPNMIGPFAVPTPFEVQRTLFPFTVAPQPGAQAAAVVPQIASAPIPQDDGAATYGKHAAGTWSMRDPGLTSTSGAADSDGATGAAGTTGTGGTTGTPGITGTGGATTGNSPGHRGFVGAVLDDSVLHGLTQRGSAGSAEAPHGGGSSNSQVAEDDSVSSAPGTDDSGPEPDGADHDGSISGGADHAA